MLTHMYTYKQSRELSGKWLGRLLTDQLQERAQLSQWYSSKSMSGHSLNKARKS